MNIKKIKGSLPGELIPDTPAKLLGFQENLTLALCQVGSEIGNVKANLEKALALIKEAAGEGADLVAFPETYLTNYVGQYEGRYVAEPIPGPVTEELTKAAMENDIYIVMGMPVCVREFPGLVTNSALVVGPEEGVMGVYDKITLPTFHNAQLLVTEGNYWSPGTKFPIFKIKGWDVAVNICQDAWLPEIPRIQALQGAQVILSIAAGPTEFKSGWPLVLRTRALENRVFQAFCNVVGSYRNASFFGGNCIITPNGDEIVGGIENEEAMVIGTVNIHTLYHARTQFPGLRPGYDLQPYLYEQLVKPIQY
ncbi:MAG: carbon-nitrogen hydrolase family protein [Acutalibacteraceae bacterium]